jgi:hypothetical protein
METKNQGDFPIKIRVTINKLGRLTGMMKEEQHMGKRMVRMKDDG